MGSFQPGLLNLANWMGNVMLPIGAGLILACGIYQFSKGQELERYIYGAMAALLGSGLLRLAEVISQQNGGADQYMVMLLTVTNFVGNVLMPFYAAIEIVRLVLGIGGVFERLAIGDDWVRHGMAAMGALLVSGLLRLLEYFVANASYEERRYGTELVTGIEEPSLEGDHPVSRTRRFADHHVGCVRRNAHREFLVLRPLHLSHTDELLPAAGDPAGWSAGIDDLQVR